MRPGSDQYPGITPLQTVLAFGPLPAQQAYVCGEIYCVGMGRVTVLGQYAKLESPPNGETTYYGTGVSLTISLSPYALTSQVPVLESEWWPITIIAPDTVEGCQNNIVVGEASVWTFCGVETDDTLETFTFDVSLPSHAQRIKICAAELSGASIGQFGCLALLSLDPGGEFGWTINGGHWAARG